MISKENENRAKNGETMKKIKNRKEQRIHSEDEVKQFVDSVKKAARKINSSGHFNN